MSISSILRQPSTPTSSQPPTPISSPVSPSHRRRLEFLDPVDVSKAEKPSKCSKLSHGDAPKVTGVASPILKPIAASPSSKYDSPVAFTMDLQNHPEALSSKSGSPIAFILDPQNQAASPSNQSNSPVEFQDYALPKVSSFRSARIRLGDTLPKIDMDFITGQKFLTWQNKRYGLTSVSTESMERQHQVWLGKTPDEPNKVVMKTYNHIVNINKRESLMKGDRLGFDIWQQFLKDHSFPEIQLPKIYSRLQDAVLVMEYICVEPEKLAFWSEWENKGSLEGLSKEAMKILEIARDVIALMWKNKIDLGDFRAENAIWKEGKLYPIDWQYIPESEKGDLVMHLKHYLRDWAKGNDAVYAFLSQPVPDLLSASSSSKL